MVEQDKTSHSQSEQVSRLWGGRFASGPSEEMDRLNRSLPVDARLWREDIRGSEAWVAALAAAGVISSDEGAALETGLGAVAERLAGWDAGDWAAAPDEDIHSLVERLLREEAGPVAGKMHTGRSRNDQVATDTRLWARGAVGRLDGALAALQEALLAQAEGHVETVMPAYTHLQRAQPVTAAHWLLSHAWPLARDRARLGDALRRVDVLPLGSGAISGCPFPVNRALLRERLGFAESAPNSMDAVADRDWVAELLFVAAMVGVHLSRLAEDLIVFGSGEFRLVRFSDAYSTGSSLMPQKRNPDAMELARGKAGRLIGELAGILTTLKALPSGYNKDLQEDKSALFSVFDTLEVLLPAVAGTVRTLEIDAERAAAALDDGMFATELADFLVGRGMPFREAHEVIGGIFREAEERGDALSELPAESFTEASELFEGADLGALFDAEAAVARRTGEGGTSPESVRAQIERLREMVG